MCRDNSTHNLLKRKNVDAKFFGCLTQLLDIKHIPDNSDYKERYKDSIIYIDCPDKWKKRDNSEKNYYFEHYINELLNMTPKQRIDYAYDLLSKYKYAKKIYSQRLHAFLPCRAMGLDIEYVGHMNYRVEDLVNNIPDKSKLKKKFVECVERKTDIN